MNIRIHPFFSSLFLIPAIYASPCMGSDAEKEKAAQAAAVQLLEVYQKSWPVVEKTWAYLIREVPQFGKFSLLCQVYIYPEYNEIVLFNEGGKSYVIKIRNKKLYISEKSKKEGGGFSYKDVGSFNDDIENDFIKTLILPLEKVIEKGQGKLHSVSVLFTLNSAKVTAVNENKGLMSTYCYQMKNGKWELYNMTDFDI